MRCHPDTESFTAPGRCKRSLLRTLCTYGKVLSWVVLKCWLQQPSRTTQHPMKLALLGLICLRDFPPLSLLLHLEGRQRHLPCTGPGEAAISKRT